MRIAPAIIITLAAGLASTHAAVADSDSPFTYQGELKDGGSLANGTFNMTFRLYDADTGGTLLASQPIAGVTVTEGRFTVTIDFGAEVFYGIARPGLWLEIEVDGTILAPRQPLTGAPSAITTRGIFVNEDETFVGVGRSAPINGFEGFGIGGGVNNWHGMYVRTGAIGRPFYGYSLHGAQSAYHYLDGATDDWHLVNGGATRLTVRDDGFVGVGRETEVTGSEDFGIQSPAGTNAYGGMYINTAAAGGWPFYGYATGGVSRAWHYYDGSTGAWHLNNSGARLTVHGDGRVGIGTTAPSGLLHVNGNYYGLGDMMLHAVEGDGANGIAYLQAGDTTSTTNVSLRLRTKAGSNWRDNLFLSSGGAVGVGTIGPNFTLEVNGSAGKPGGGSWSNSSDARLKKNIEDLDGALNQLLQLRGVTFEYIDPDAINERPGTRIGMIAQEVETIFPDWVDQRKDGYKAVTFRGFEALAVEAMRELRAEKDSEIARLQSVNESQADEIENLRARMFVLEAMVEALAAEREGR